MKGRAREKGRRKGRRLKYERDKQRQRACMEYILEFRKFFCYIVLHKMLFRLAIQTVKSKLAVYLSVS